MKNKWIKHWVSGAQIKDYQYRCSNCGKSYWKWHIEDFHRCPNCNDYKSGVESEDIQ